MYQVQKKDLTGYRQPVQWEKKRIQEYMLKELARARRSILIGTVLCGVAEACLFIILVTGFSGSPLGLNIVWATMALVFMMGFLTLLKRMQWNRRYIKNIRTGSFQVMDCKAYEANPDADIVNGGTVKIYNEQGQYSRDSFTADFESVKMCSENPSVWFLLMKTTCGVEKEELYELFTERKLERR